jgi:hypothetical protein
MILMLTDVNICSFRRSRPECFTNNESQLQAGQIDSSYLMRLSILSGS